jgi:hypothetical protein
MLMAETVSASASLPRVRLKSVWEDVAVRVLVYEWMPVQANAVDWSTATVMVSVAEPVVVIPVPAAMVKVSPWEMVWLDPEVPAAVNKVPPETTQVPQVKVKVPPKDTAPPPPSGEVVLTVSDELTNSALPTELLGKTTSPSPVESVANVIAVVPTAEDPMLMAPASVRRSRSFPASSSKVMAPPFETWIWVVVSAKKRLASQALPMDNALEVAPAEAPVKFAMLIP